MQLPNKLLHEGTLNRFNFTGRLWALPPVLVGMVLLSALAAAAPTPSIEGTYQLISRKLPDGTVIKPPEIIGLWTYTKSHRNYNLVRRDVSGKCSSRSSVSTYKLTGTEYSETVLFSIVNDQIGGKEIVYDLSNQTRSVPVKLEGRSIQFKSPFTPPTLVFEGNKLTATVEGEFIDVWQKVQ